MNREIKFRGQNSFSFNWIIGSLLIKDETPDIIMTYTGNKHDVFPESIGQFTGIYDCESKEVFEGDVLEVIYYNHTGKNCKLIQEVYYLEESGCFCVKTVGKEVSPIENDRNNVPLHWTSQPNTIKVIGNIHENPELLHQPKVN